MRAHKQFRIEFEDLDSSTWVLLRTWKRNEFIRVAIGVIDRYFGVVLGELTIVGRIISAVGIGASLIALFGCSHVLVECYWEYLGSGYTKFLAYYPTFKARLLKRCLWKTLSVKFATLDLSFPGLLNVVSNIIGVWPLFSANLKISQLKETRKKDSSDSFVLGPFI